MKVLQKTLPTVKSAAAHRSKVTTDKYEKVTWKILNGNVEGDFYHPNCYRQFTAVRRPRESKNLRLETRTNSSLPKTDKQGILKEKCVFCGKAREKKKGKRRITVRNCNKRWL